MNLNERAIAAAVAATAKAPPHKTPAELEAERDRLFEAEARKALEAWFTDKGLSSDEVAHTLRIRVRAVLQASSNKDGYGGGASFWYNLAIITFVLDGHEYWGEYIGPGYYKTGLELFIQIEPDYSSPGWYARNNLIAVPTLEHIGYALVEERRRLALPIDRGAARAAGLILAEKFSTHGLPCPDCGNNTRTAMVVAGVLYLALSGCAHCRTGRYFP